MVLDPSSAHDAESAEPLDVEAVFRRYRADIERWAARLGVPWWTGRSPVQHSGA